MTQDFNNAQVQRTGDLIPDKTLAKVMMTVRPGRSPLSPWATPSQSSDAHYLDCEFVILEGEHAKRKFWSRMTIAGGKLDKSGNSAAGEITRARLRAILESARNVNPADMSPEAMQKRRADYGDFDNMIFAVKIKLKKGEIKNQATGERYNDANDIDTVITPDKSEYAQLMSGVNTGFAQVAQAPATYAQGGSAPVGNAAFPSWQR